MIPLYCKTDDAILLVAINQDNRIKFLTQNQKDLPGLHFEVKARTPIQVQLQEVFEKIVTLNQNHFLEIIQDFSESVQNLSTGKTLTLYLGKITLPSELKQNISLKTLEELFKEMPKNKNRIVYLRLIQTLLGVHKEQVYVDLEEDKKN